MQLPNVLEEWDGEIVVKGHRITLYDIITAHNEKWIGREMMVFHFPTLSLYQVEQVLEFYRANRTEVDEYVREYTADLERQRAEGTPLDTQELRRRLAANAANGKPTPPPVPSSP